MNIDIELRFFASAGNLYALIACFIHIVLSEHNFARRVVVSFDAAVDTVYGNGNAACIQLVAHNIVFSSRADN